MWKRRLAMTVTWFLLCLAAACEWGSVPLAEEAFAVGEGDGTTPPWEEPPPILAPPPGGVSCGLYGDAIVYPRTSDPLQPPDPQEAYNTPAVAGDGVLLHDRSLLARDSAMRIDRVGLPFDFAISYRSNVKQTQGGLLGQGWDFDYNERVVPVGPKADSGLVREPKAGIPALAYYDGDGRKDSFGHAHSEFRTVTNFGTRLMTVWVTVYKSPPGAFFTLQRYALPRGTGADEPSPFASHPDVHAGDGVWYVKRDKYGRRSIFGCRGELLHRVDENENTMTFVHKGPLNPLTQNPMLSSITDTVGRGYSLGYAFIGDAVFDTWFEGKWHMGRAPIPRVAQLGDEDGRWALFGYRFGTAEAVLETVSLRVPDRVMMDGETLPGGTFTTEYGYTPAPALLLERITRPEGRIPLATATGPAMVVGWSTAGQVLRQSRGNGGLGFSGADPVLVTDDVGNKTSYDLVAKSLSKVVDSETVTSASGADRGPWVTRFEYNADYQVTREILPSLNEIVREYDLADEPLPKVAGSVIDWEPSWMLESNGSRGNLVKVIRKSNRTADVYKEITTGYDYAQPFNRVREITDGRLNKITYSFHNRLPNERAPNPTSAYNGRPVTRTVPRVTRSDKTLTALTTTYAYTDRGQLFTETGPSPRRAVTTYSYDARHYLAAIAPPRDPSRPVDPHRFERDGRGNLIGETLPGGTQHRYLVDHRDLRVAAIEHDATAGFAAAGFRNRADYVYDKNGKLILDTRHVKDNFDPLFPDLPAQAPIQVETKTEYDVLDRVTALVEDFGGRNVRTDYGWTKTGQIETVRRPSPAGAGTVTERRSYDGRGLLLAVIHAEATPAAGTVGYGYDKNGNLKTVTDENKLSTTYLYDGFDRQTGAIDPAGGVLSLVLDKNGNVEQRTFVGVPGPAIVGPTGYTTKVTLQRAVAKYDELDRRYELTQHLLGAAPAGSATVTQWRHDGDGLLEAQVGPGIRGSTYRYYPDLLLEAVVGGEGNETHYDYDAAGQVERIDERESEPKATPLSGGVAASRAATRTPVSYATTLKRDSLGRLIRVEDSGGHATLSYYDSRGLVRGATDVDGKLTATTYDELGRPSTIVEPGRPVMVLDHRPAGVLASVQTGDMKRTHWHDQRGRVVRFELTGPDPATPARTVTIEPDVAGRPWRVTDANGTVTTSSFDWRGQPTYLQTSYSTVAYGPKQEWLAYDGLGRLAHGQTDLGVVVDRAFDGLGRVIVDRQTVDGLYREVVSTYSADLGRRTITRRDPGYSLDRSETYDRLGRIMDTDRASYSYAGRGRVAFRSLPLLGAHTRYEYAERLPTHVSGLVGGQPWDARQKYDVHRRSSHDRSFVMPTTPECSTCGTRRGTTKWLYESTKFDDSARPAVSDSRRVETDTRYFDYGGSEVVSKSNLLDRTVRTYRADGRPDIAVRYVAEEASGTPIQIRRDVFQPSAHDSNQIRAVDTVNVKAPAVKTLDELRAIAGGASAGALDFGGSRWFGRDGAGNLTDPDGLQLLYDREGRLTRGLNNRALMSYQVTFRYDSLGRLVQKDYGASVQADYGLDNTRLVYDGARLLDESDKFTSRAYHYGAGDELVMVRLGLDELAVPYVDGGIRFVAGKDGKWVEPTLVRVANRGSAAPEHAIEVNRLGSDFPLLAPGVRHEPLLPGIRIGDDGSVVDYQHSPELDDFLVGKGKRLAAEADAAFWKSVAVAVGVTALAIAAAVVCPPALALASESWIIAAGVGGVLGLGFGAGVSWLAGADYDEGDALLDFGIGALTGGLTMPRLFRGVVGPVAAARSSRAAYTIAVLWDAPEARAVAISAGFNVATQLLRGASAHRRGQVWEFNWTSLGFDMFFAVPTLRLVNAISTKWPLFPRGEAGALTSSERWKNFRAGQSAILAYAIPQAALRSYLSGTPFGETVLGFGGYYGLSTAKYVGNEYLLASRLGATLFPGGRRSGPFQLMSRSTSTGLKLAVDYLFDMNTPADLRGGRLLVTSTPRWHGEITEGALAGAMYSPY